MRNLSDLTLDELITCLIAGDEVKVANDAVFKIADEVSQRALAFYNRDRNAYWNPDKDTNILEGEIDRLLDALDKPIKAASIAERPAADLAKWRLTKIAAHRFRGLHRHCADNGDDPDPFSFEVSTDGTLLRGFNGAGKTSLISAICWCLTGYGYRSQALPAPLHQTIEVRVPPESESGSEGTAFEIPAVVPVPNEEELVWVDGAPKDDTWVKLTFVSLIDGQEVTVERHLKRQGKRGFLAEPIGLEKLGLSDLALQVGSLMPGIAASTRFDEKTTLSQAISTLTGFRPLAHFGKRSARLYDRLSKKYPDDAEKAKREALALLATQKETLQDLLKAAIALPAIDCLVVPSDGDPTAWQHGFEESEERLKAFEETAAAEATSILGKLPSLTTEAEVNRFDQNLKTTRALFSNAALKGLPSIQDAQLLAAITEEEATEIESVCADIEEEARALAQQLADVARSDRLRLYALVARWHNAAHPGEPIDHCPVCATDLAMSASIPNDALLGKSVKDALEASREAGEKATVTAAEWERRTAQELRSRLPESAHPFIDKTLPDTLPALYKKALSTEIFGQRDFPATFKNLSAGLSKVFETAWGKAPDAAQLHPFSLPAAIPDQAGLRTSIANVLKAVRLSRYRSVNGEFAKSAMSEVLEANPQPPVRPANERSGLHPVPKTPS